MDAYHILVIILSVALAILLVAGIILTIVLVKLVNQIRRITKKAELVMDEVEAVSAFFRKTAAPAAIGKLVSNIVSTISKRRKDKDE